MRRGDQALVFLLERMRFISHLPLTSATFYINILGEMHSGQTRG